jgi:hypothetical protein
MNGAMRQKLNTQAQEMGVEMSEATVKWNKKDGYHLEGYKDFIGLKNAVDKGVEQGSLRSGISARMKKIDEAG